MSEHDTVIVDIRADDAERVALMLRLEAVRTLHDARLLDDEPGLVEFRASMLRSVASANRVVAALDHALDESAVDHEVTP